MRRVAKPRLGLGKRILRRIRETWEIRGIASGHDPVKIGDGIQGRVVGERPGQRASVALTRAIVKMQWPGLGRRQGVE